MTELLRPGGTLDDARGQFSLRYLFVRAGDGAIMREHLDRYERWLRDRGLDHSPGRFRRWVAEGYRPGTPCREQWPYDPYPLVVITRPAATIRAAGRRQAGAAAVTTRLIGPFRANRGRRAVMSESHEIAIRVRYAETDRMGLLHHANYFVYFEMGRTELLRQRGISYRDIEDAGHLLVIVDIGCKFKRPAYYDDLLTLRTTVDAGHARQDRASIRGVPRRRAPGRGPFDAGLRRPRGQAAAAAGHAQGRRDLSRGFARLDTGTTDSLIQGDNDVEAIEHRHGLRIARIEQVADRRCVIDGDQLQRLAAIRIRRGDHGVHATGESPSSLELRT